MKRNSKKTISVAFASTLLITSIGSTTANAYSKPQDTSIQPINDIYIPIGEINTIDSNEFDITDTQIFNSIGENVSGVTTRSVTSLKAPLPGAIKVGKPVYRSKYANYSTAALAAAAIASISGLPADKVLSSYGTLTIALQALGKSDVFYIRQKYESKSRDMYYYKYSYYKYSNYSGYLGTSYSYVYGKWA
ncbi:MAG: hypothetical protein MJH09_10610 [Cetobacterium sp.]|nr:hypothetical protein [Cetobacterium sp.]